MQTLVDMAEKHSTEDSHRMLLAAESVAEGFSLAGWLEREGFDVLTATDGQEALQIAGSSWQPDVVLLDLPVRARTKAGIQSGVAEKGECLRAPTRPLAFRRDLVCLAKIWAGSFLPFIGGEGRYAVAPEPHTCSTA
jgi:hypothetical protein